MISRIVPAEALAHVSFCRVAGRQLRITLDNAAWIPRLRFGERQLLAALAREGMDVRTVSWHVTPAKPPSARTPARRRAAGGSESAARAVLSAALAVDDEELAGQLRLMARRLAARAKETPAPNGERDEGARDRADDAPPTR